jgi:hypothetical protein
MKMNDLADAGKTNPIKANFKRGKIQWFAKFFLGGYNYYGI